jgi:hypothetical protein
MEHTGRAKHSKVARLAYQLWEIHGRPHGRDQEFWFLAEDTAGHIYGRAAPVSFLATQTNSSRPVARDTLVVEFLCSIPQLRDWRQ